MRLSKRWRRLLWILGPALVVLAFLAWVPLWMVRAFEWASPAIVWRVETSQPVAALTFDDGPDPVNTPQVLEILARHNVRATFFLVGEHARQHPELVARIRAAGHEIGNHTDSLGTTFFMSGERFEASLLRAEQSLGLDISAAQHSAADSAAAEASAQTWPRRKLLRPAGGTIRASQRALARRHGYTIVLGSSYAWDPAQPPAGYIRWAISKNLEPGAIAVLHDAKGDRANTVAALDGILADARAKGLRWVTLSELLAHRE
jgi:peptidoglycan/xylan/chitin deacetylase (PgdA/CDA1 family)